MTKKQTTAPETVRSDYALVQVTLTLAVETWLCDADFVSEKHDRVIEIVFDKLDIEDEIMVLASEFTPLTLTKAVKS